MIKPLQVCPDKQTLASTVAAQISEAIQAHDSAVPFSLVLAGGSTPKLLYECLASALYRQLPWGNVHVFWGDERCVAPDHQESNFKMAKETLLDHVPIPAQNVYRMLGELTPPHSAAQNYRSTLENFFRKTHETVSRLDLVLLGMGTDGHTASLFPQQPSLKDQTQWVMDVHYPSVKPPWRITLALPLLQQAKRTWFVVAGADKQRVMNHIAADPLASVDTYPAALVHSRSSAPKWFVEEASLHPNFYPS